MSTQPLDVLLGWRQDRMQQQPPLPGLPCQQAKVLWFATNPDVCFESVPSLVDTSVSSHVSWMKSIILRFVVLGYLIKKVFSLDVGCPAWMHARLCASAASLAVSNVPSLCSLPSISRAMNLFPLFLAPLYLMLSFITIASLSSFY